MKEQFNNEEILKILKSLVAINEELVNRIELLEEKFYGEEDYEEEFPEELILDLKGGFQAQ